jgi:hypothetical protein
MLIFKIDLEDVRAYPDESVNWPFGLAAIFSAQCGSWMPMFFRLIAFLFICFIAPCAAQELPRFGPTPPRAAAALPSRPMCPPQVRNSGHDGGTEQDAGYPGRAIRAC